MKECPITKAYCFSLHCTGDYCGLQGVPATGTNAQGNKTMAAVTPTTPAAPPCHYGLHKLGTINECKIWIGRVTGVLDQPVVLRIALDSGGFDSGWKAAANGATVANGAARELIRTIGETRNIPELEESLIDPQQADIVIDWPDYGVPNFTRAWWDYLINLLEGINGHVQVGCLGGHGRTGTFAAILAGIQGWHGSEDVVAWLRKQYCVNAVESYEQIAYIEEITGLVVKAKEGKGLGLPFRPGTGSVVSIKTGKGVPPKPAALSRKKWKRWARKSGDMRHIDVLEDGEFFEIEESLFIWDKVSGVFHNWDKLTLKEQEIFMEIDNVRSQAPPPSVTPPDYGHDLIGRPERLHPDEISQLWHFWGMGFVKQPDGGWLNKESDAAKNIMRSHYAAENGLVRRGDLILHIGTNRWVVALSEYGKNAEWVLNALSLPIHYSPLPL